MNPFSSDCAAQKLPRLGVGGGPRRIGELLPQILARYALGPEVAAPALVAVLPARRAAVPPPSLLAQAK